MTLETKRIIIAALAGVFLLSLIFVQYNEVTRRRAEAGLGAHNTVVPASSKSCVDCHTQSSPGTVEHWKGSTHAEKGVGCYDCHKADLTDPDAWQHEGSLIATVVTPRDCGRCHTTEQAEFSTSHHAKAGQILASLDNYLAETIEGSRLPFNPHSKTPGKDVDMVNGMASVQSGCLQCHGSKVALEASDGGLITFEDLKPDKDGKPTNLDAIGRIKKDKNGRPILAASTWPNTGIGRMNLDGSLGSCSACHSRHDFSPRRARQPENCGKCHLGPDHPQKEIYDESKHGVAFADMRDLMNLSAKTWILGKDYSAAPTCATCHMSAHSKNGKVTHDPGERISWTNRPAISQVMDTDINHKVVTEAEPTKRAALISDTAEQKRNRMKDVCTHCHSGSYVVSFYKQYDDFIINYNEKFAKPGAGIIKSMRDNGLLTKAEFDEEIEWTWFYLWHHEGRRARHGASMMAPDYAHWHGMFEVAENFYTKLIPQARAIAEEAIKNGKATEGQAVLSSIDELLARPEHKWFEAELKVKPTSSPTSLPIP
jgi:hydroxylamine dehydrogenase